MQFSLLCLDGHFAQRQRFEPCSAYISMLILVGRVGEGKGLEGKLTAVDVFGGLLLLCAGAVLGVGLCGETGFGAGSVEVAAVVHGFLEGVAFPAEDVVSVSGGTTVRHVSIGSVRLCSPA
jgi:hypothetical protein